MRTYLEGLRHGQGMFGVPELALSGFVRIVTAPKPFDPPTQTAVALDFCASLLASPRCVRVQPIDSQWATFDRLCRTTNARGKLVPDAYLAAMAIDLGFELITTDADFRRFP